MSPSALLGVRGRPSVAFYWCADVSVPCCPVNASEAGAVRSTPSGPRRGPLGSPTSDERRKGERWENGMKGGMKGRREAGMVEEGRREERTSFLVQTLQCN